MNWINITQKLPPHKKTVLLTHRGSYFIGHYDKFAGVFRLNNGDLLTTDKGVILWQQIAPPPAH
jgi:hypothetical protein